MLSNGGFNVKKTININSKKIIKTQKNFWNNFLFHPTDGVEDDWGYKILKHISEDKAAKNVRIYSMFEDIVSIDENGNFKYDFTLNDIRIDRLLECGFTPLIAYGVVPACIALDPNMNNGVSHNAKRYKGKKYITSIPKDYSLWEEICYEYTKHIVERYGIEEVSKWHIQCLNEPDSPLFFLPYATPEERNREYFKLYCAFERGVNRVSREIKIGGPTVSGVEDIYLLDDFLKNVTENNIRLSYVAVHAYGNVPWMIRNGSKPFAVANHFDRIHIYRDIIKKYYPQGIEFVVDEWGACTNGDREMTEFPELEFRETPKFAAYFMNMIAQYIHSEEIIPSILMICLSGQHTMKAEFEGFRNFFSLSFIKKPIYNAHILASKLHESILEFSSDVENLAVIPTKNDDGAVSIMLSHASEDFADDISPVDDVLEIHGIEGEKEISIWTIDDNNTFPYGKMKECGFSEPLTEEQIEFLKNESNLTPKKYKVSASGTISLDVQISGNGIMLVEVK